MNGRQEEKRFRIAVSGIYHETNTFAPGMTELSHFQKEWIKGENFVARYKGTRTSMGGIIDAAEAENIELVPGLYTYATPGGTVKDETMGVILSELLASLDSEADGIILVLHGAMVSESLFDVEGELLRSIRHRCGATKAIAVTIDLHANITPEMVEFSNIMVGYDTYPHIDAYERAIDAFILLSRQLRGEIRPVTAWRTAGMLVVPQSMVTNQPPMKDLLDAASAIEADKRVLKVSVAGGFPYSDVPHAGMSFIVITDNDPELAVQYANRLRELAWNGRYRFQTLLYDVERALHEAFTYPESPVILVEGSDNVGGGAPADGTHLLKQLLDAPRKSLMVICDREASELACSVGVGASFNGYVGGKSDRLHGSPVWIAAEVIKISGGTFRHVGPYMTGQWAYMGKTAVLESGNLTLVVTGERIPPWDIGHVTSLGLEPADFHIITVKSAIAWRTAFGDIAKRSFDVDTPGCCSAVLTHFQYKNLNRPIYPLDAETAIE